MLKLYYVSFLLLRFFVLTKCLGVNQTGVLSTKAYVFWPNATIPFYINPDHFDHEQAMAIMTSLSTFAFKTCLKFAPVMAAPQESQHVMVFINPEGIRRCKIQLREHSNYHPHLIAIGYECLQSPEIDMFIMRALGFPFEHNRMSRDVYIDILIENIEPNHLDLFTKDSALPPALRALPYDINSVMHFGERDYSKNGHRTIMFKNHQLYQNRRGLSSTDLRKIEVIYGPECRQRDRQEKIELCQSYPGVARRKREVQRYEHKSLRVNPDITPPPLDTTTVIPDAEKVPEEYDAVSDSLKKLGIVNETEDIIEKIFKLSALALTHAREKYCNNTNSSIPNIKYEKPVKKEKTKGSDLLNIIQIIAEYVEGMVDNAIHNLTVFCKDSESIVNYQRGCSWNFNNRCPVNYRSTKGGAVKHSTQHRPVYKQMTKHEGVELKYSYDKPNYRTGNNTGPDQVTTTLTTALPKRKKRQVASSAATPNPPEESKKSKKEKKKKTMKAKLKSMLKEKVEVEKVKSESSSNSTKPKEDKPRRYFQEKRYKVKHPKDQNEAEWEASNVSLDKRAETENQEKLKQKEQGIEDERKQERERERMKEKEEPFASGNIKDEMIKGKATKDVDSNEELDEVEDVKTIGDEEEQLEEAEKGPVLQKSVESDVETVAENTKYHKGRNKNIFDLDVEKPNNRDSIEKARDHMKQRKRSHGFVPRTVALNKLNQEFYDERKWPDGQVIYVVKELRGYDLDDLRARLSEVNSILTRKTCVKLREVGAKEADGFEDVLILDNSPDYVTGRVGGKQTFGCVELFQGGQHRQHTAMMVMAMLGFYFEVSRHDRDKHIRVHNRHVRPDKLHHFEKIRDEATLDVPYDYKSATHPAWQFWRKIGKTGISTVATYKELDPDGSVMRSLGQNEELLSEYDIIKINSIYGIECFENERKDTKSKRHRDRNY